MNQSSDKILDNYIIGKTLGKGTFGKVKKAVHKVSGELVAIKILQKNKIKDITDVQRVNRQLHILKFVRHASIAQLYEIIQTPQIIFIVMQYADNGEFFDYIMDGKIQSEAEAHHYFAQILDGLEYLHNCKIAHRDIKPENMLLDTNARVKMVDFGLSNMYSVGQKLTTACGSPCYASPEMIKGQQYDPQLTDIWSLGVVLYTMIFAKLPFEDDNTSILYSKIKAGLFIIDKKISPQLKNLLNGMICVKTSSRLTIKGIKEHSWFKNKPIYQPGYGIIIGYQKIPIDESVLSQLIQLFANMKVVIQKDQARKQIQSNVKNATTATYYILLKRNYKRGTPSKADICYSQFDRRLLKKQPVKPRVVRHKSFNVMAYYTQTQNFKHQGKANNNNNDNANPGNVQKKKQSKEKIESMHRRAKSLTKSQYYDEQRVKSTQKKNSIIHQIYLPKKLGPQRLLLTRSQQKPKQYNKFIKSIQEQHFKNLQIGNRQFLDKNTRLKTEGNQDNKDFRKNSKKNIIKQYQTSYSNRRYSNNTDKRVSISISMQKQKRKTMNEKPKENSRYQKQKKQLDIGVFWKKRSVQVNGLTRKVNKGRV